MEWVQYNCVLSDFQSSACDSKLRRYVRTLGEKLLKIFNLKLTGGSCPNKKTRGRRNAI